MPRKPSSPTSKRRAASLLVVVLFIMRFLVIGMCFLLFSEAQATSSRYFREANSNVIDQYPTAEELLSAGLASLIYGSNDDDGAFNAMRGLDLARNMYG